MRSGDPTAFVIVDEETGSVLGSAEQERAFSTVHEGALYLHLGEQYAVTALDLETRTALVRPVTVDWYTQARKETSTEIARSLRSRRVAGVELHHGGITVREQVIGFQRKAIADGSVIDAAPLDLPETSFETEGVWFSPAEWLLEGIDTMPTLVSALHAAEHSLISLLPLFAMCDRWDIGGLSTNVHEQTGLPTIFVYEGHVEVREPQRAHRQSGGFDTAHAHDQLALLPEPPLRSQRRVDTDTCVVSCDRVPRGPRSPLGSAGPTRALGDQGACPTRPLDRLAPEPRQRELDCFRRGGRARHTRDGRPALEDDHGAAEPHREADLGERPPAPADCDHRVAGGRHGEVPRVPDARHDDVVGPLVRLRVRLTGDDGDRRPACLARAAERPGHHLAEPPGDHDAAMPREQPPHFQRGRLVIAAPDHGHLRAAAGHGTKEKRRGRTGRPRRSRLRVRVVLATGRAETKGPRW